ncbi:53L [Xanthomonas phage Xp10]|uniref:53L n=1 Tax=Xanthomonas phage Xp10 TaxID=2907956 RepID=Q7Y5G3_9CAUD|nr:hypothetical protein Xp10p54 [Xanthomonas phage Xp10]AAP58721.1 53L [Xanthomonas phage Xp10]
MRIMPIIVALSLCAASAAASGTTMAWKDQKTLETRSERCEGEVREMAQVFRLRVQVMQPDLLELMTLDRPADQLKRIKAVYSIDMRGYGPATLAQAEALLQMHFELCKNSA